MHILANLSGCNGDDVNKERMKDSLDNICRSNPVTRNDNLFKAYITYFVNEDERTAETFINNTSAPLSSH